jgi:hypothetical protein
MDVVKGDLRTALTPEIDCDQTVMGLTLVMSAVFLLAKLVAITSSSKNY